MSKSIISILSSLYSAQINLFLKGEWDKNIFYSK